MVDWEGAVTNPHPNPYPNPNPNPNPHPNPHPDLPEARLGGFEDAAEHGTLGEHSPAALADCLAYGLLVLEVRTALALALTPTLTLALTLTLTSTLTLNRWATNPYESTQAVTPKKSSEERVPEA